MKRLQRKRTKGWRMPAGAVYVGRPSPWGNPVLLGEHQDRLEGRTSAITSFRWLVANMPELERQAWLEPLRQATALVCWCPTSQACHADVLIELLAG